MESTGRIQRTLTRRAQRMLFEQSSWEEVAQELGLIARIDRAHLVMLAECGLVAAPEIRRLLSGIEKLQASNFDALRGRPRPRGIYMLYEGYLIEELGAETGGVLQTGRSRNDLGATALSLRLRLPFAHLLRESLRLQAVLLSQARRHGGTVMPVYTHFQAALPITFGHYLAGVGEALQRDVEGLLGLRGVLDRCPLGAGAGGGTALPIDPSRTARLLGFSRAAANSIDAVASRDIALRLLAGAAILGLTLSRLSADLLLWSSAEFGFLHWPDHLVGASSMMPQKRNPFPLEHVQGRSASAAGAFASALTAMHAKPFSNSISVGTEAVSHLWKALRDVTEAVLLARLMVRGAEPYKEAMLERAERGYTGATELANRLVIESGVPFRSAHHAVGSLIREEMEGKSRPLSEAAAAWPGFDSLRVSLEGLDPASIARRSDRGGGPGALDACLQGLLSGWKEQRRRKRDLDAQWLQAETLLDEAVEGLLESSVTASAF